MRTYGYDTYFNTQNETLTEFYRFITDRGYTYEPLTCFQTEHIAYDTSITYHMPLKTAKGNNARKWAHAHICRLSSGRYELTMHLS
jgi:hypothetical protein